MEDNFITPDFIQTRRDAVQAPPAQNQQQQPAASKSAAGNFFQDNKMMIIVFSLVVVIVVCLLVWMMTREKKPEPSKRPPPGPQNPQPVMPPVGYNGGQPVGYNGAPQHDHAHAAPQQPLVELAEQTQPQPKPRNPPKSALKVNKREAIETADDAELNKFMNIGEVSSSGEDSSDESQKDNVGDFDDLDEYSSSNE